MEQGKTRARSKRANSQKRTVRQNGMERSSKYNYLDMRDDTVQLQQGFAKRLSSIRAAKGISAREMSLSLGQGAGYINNIENGKNHPSMSMFFEICEYLDISPKEFFDYPQMYEGNAQQMLMAFERLEPEEQELLIKLAEKLKRG